MRFLPFFVLWILPFSISAQTFKGQWKGEFSDKSGSNGNWGGERCDYVIELESHKNKVSGYSYTYFMDNGKRFYTICRLEGQYDAGQKALEIREVERTKTNVPKDIKNCFQLHKLTYFKKGSEEILTGEWVPVPGQPGDCGFGDTRLTRRVLTAATGNYSNKPAAAVSPKPAAVAGASSLPSSVVKVNPVQKAAEIPGLAQNNQQPLNNPDLPVLKEPEVKSGVLSEVVPARPPGFERRESRVLRTIEVDNQYIKLDLFDNGEIDGDSITLFYNNMMLVTHKRLTDKPITFTIMVDDDEVGEFEMYAENLGAIPPNSAVMVVTDGNKRYEARITSDLKKSGAIRFVRKKKS